MAKPVVAAKEPIKANLDAGETYHWRRCGLSKTQPDRVETDMRFLLIGPCGIYDAQIRSSDIYEHTDTDN